MSALTRLDELWEKGWYDKGPTKESQEAQEELKEILDNTYPELRELVRAQDAAIKAIDDLMRRTFCDGRRLTAVESLRNHRATWESRLQEEIDGEHTSERRVDLEADLFANWEIPCVVCEQKPTVSFKPTRIYEAGRGKGIEMKRYDTELCGVCHYGTTSELRWYDDVPLDRHIGEPGDF